MASLALHPLSGGSAGQSRIAPRSPYQSANRKPARRQGQNHLRSTSVTATANQVTVLAGIDAMLYQIRAPAHGNQANTAIEAPPMTGEWCGSAHQI